MASVKRFFPAFLDLERRLVVVIGEGKPAEKRVRQLLRYGADVVVVSPSPSDELLEAEADGLLTLERRAYVRGDLSGAFLALCVTDDAEVRRAVFEEAESASCLVNVAGSPEYCNFILPSVITRGALQVGISTGGLAPEVAKAFRKALDEEVGDEWGPWIALLVDVRAMPAEDDDEVEVKLRALQAAALDSTRQRIGRGERLTAPMLLSEARRERETEREAARIAAKDELPVQDSESSVSSAAPDAIDEVAEQ